MKKWILLMTAFGFAATAAPASAGAGAAIIGGGPATTDEYPWVVAVINERQSQQRPWRSGCGGALVAPDKVVTAAHCVDEDPAENFTVAAGRTDLRTDAGAEREVVGMWLHPEFRQQPPEPGAPALLAPDVAVLTLDRPLPHRPVPLVTEHDGESYRPGTTAVAFGWGSTTEPPAPAEPSPTLRRAEVRITADLPCLEAHEQDHSFPQTFDPAHYVCTRDVRNGATTGGGDSGGPLLADGRLIGITASGTFDLEADYASFSELITFSEEVHDQLDGPRTPGGREAHSAAPPIPLPGTPRD